MRVSQRVCVWKEGEGEQRTVDLVANKGCTTSSDKGRAVNRPTQRDNNIYMTLTIFMPTQPCSSTPSFSRPRFVPLLRPSFNSWACCSRESGEDRSLCCGLFLVRIVRGRSVERSRWRVAHDTQLLTGRAERGKLPILKE